MKKIISIMLLFILLFSSVCSLSACGEDEIGEEEGGLGNDDENSKNAGDFGFPLIPVPPVK